MLVLDTMLFNYAGDKADWQLQDGHQVQCALKGHLASMDTIGHAVAAVRQDVQPGKVPDANFLVAAAEGVLFEGLASLLRQVSSFILLFTCICQAASGVPAGYV